MIYTIAAYSITLGVLAIYFVMLQHRRRQAAEEVAGGRGLPAVDPRAGFNAGAALLAPLWMLGHGMPLPGAVLLLFCVATVPLYLSQMWLPLLFVGMVPVAAGAALAFVGNRIAVAHTGLDSPGAFSASQLPWAIAGIALDVFALPWVWYFTAGAA